MDDKEIISRLKWQDERAYEALIEKYIRYVGAIALKIAGNRLTTPDIEEICSDVFIKIWFSSKTIAVTGQNLKGYIGVMARNMTLNMLRNKSKTLMDHLEEDIVSCNSAEDIAMQKEELEILKETIAGLPDFDREIFIRRYFYLERVRDIAAEKGMNEKTLSTKLSRARERLQLAINERGI